MPDEPTTTENPFIERPDEHAVGEADELYCWMPGNDNRECNGSCVAFESAALRTDRADTCKVLNALRSIAMSFGVQTRISKAMQTRQEVSERKKAADALPKPPEVR